MHYFYGETNLNSISQMIKSKELQESMVLVPKDLLFISDPSIHLIKFGIRIDLNFIKSLEIIS
jgi:hypothetical protein